MLAVQATPPCTCAGVRVRACALRGTHPREVWTAKSLLWRSSPSRSGGVLLRRRAPRGDRPPGRTPRANSCDCIGHSAVVQHRGAALNQEGKLDTARACTVVSAGVRCNGDDASAAGTTEIVSRTGRSSAVYPTRRCSATVDRAGCRVDRFRPCGRARDDLVDVVGLLVASFLEDVLDRVVSSGAASSVPSTKRRSNG